ncbi:site-specific DNA-methyltransferase [Phycisphaera mikurensis]|uniref:site-specific DNA-methyltransferase (adenine-specific) n=1 Tax=Phycisphaera mikurensis (strain NBRC 102666 / KCTC 22515 / FYK2301M01) TaxID=1142394 RepID=I0IAN8_PHYMF|nr:site-specific DNA-methyltransferase [Phycisphaera mikurensis]MBB6441679.1 adenine-specific DNA-methyltransferase [Phycisphaera mikurensis]BAM02326.1 putative modification methylase [Phycisphaera mikurensis NBRC 102666]
MARRKKPSSPKPVVAHRHTDATRRNIPTAEMEPVMVREEAAPKDVKYARNQPGEEVREAIEAREPGLDPQLVWRGKDTRPFSELVVKAPPLFIQEKVHPRVLVEDLRRQTEQARMAKEIAGGGRTVDEQIDLFADFNGLPEDPDARTDFYHHDQHWSNRMILGDSLQVMASLAEREGLRGKVQAIYFDPPYGIKFNSNFQWSTTSRDVKDGNAEHITRDPEQVKAFRDTWEDGIHSYLTYLRDRLTAARDLLTESGSIFVQIGDENVHRVRCLMDDIFGESNFLASIGFTKTSVGLQASSRVALIFDSILWYSKDEGKGKFRRLLDHKGEGFDSQYSLYLEDDGSARGLTPEEKDSFPDSIDVNRVLQADNLTKPGPGAKYQVHFRGQTFDPGKRWWGTTEDNMNRLLKAGRAVISGKSLRYARFFSDSRYGQLSNIWTGYLGQSSPTYVVQTNTDVVARCLLMATDPGDLVLDPTCGSGTTATVAEQWGRRWITIDTSRVALALARARVMGARYPYYLLADSPEGARKEAEVTRSEVRSAPAGGHRDDLKRGFVYERVPHVTLKSIANNSEIDVIWENFQETLEPLREQLNEALGTSWEEWEIPRTWEEAVARVPRPPGGGETGSAEEDPPPGGRGTQEAEELHASWWEARIARQREIDASIAAKADSEFLYDKPYEDRKKVRVAGPFTVESLSPHRMLGTDENGGPVDYAPDAASAGSAAVAAGDFSSMILSNLRSAGVQQADKGDRIEFDSLEPWPGKMIAAEGRYTRDGKTRRLAVLIGPEFGALRQNDLTVAAVEAAESGFDGLLACGFAYEANTSDLTRVGRIDVIKARMNADLHMADLKNTGAGNLFVVFGEPDIEVLPPEDAPDGADPADYDAIRVRVRGVDVFDPKTGKVRSDSADGIACWFVDTDYNQESFFVRQAYFLGAGDPYKSLKTTLKAEIDRDAWETLNSDVSRAFPKPEGGRIAVKVINHLGDEALKVFRVG